MHILLGFRYVLLKYRVNQVDQSPLIYPYLVLFNSVIKNYLATSRKTLVISKERKENFFGDKTHESLVRSLYLGSIIFLR